MASMALLVMVALCMALLPAAFAGAARSLPTCKIKKGKKTLIVNVSDAAKWVEDGWERIDDPGPPPASDNDGDVDLDDATIVAKFRKKADVIAFAKERGLPVELSEDDSLADLKEVVLEALDAEND